MRTRCQLLEELYQQYWNDTATFESDNPAYAYVSYGDLQKLDDICTAIEAIE